MRAVTSHCNPLLARWQMPQGVEQPTLFYRVMRYGTRLTFTTFWQTRVFNRCLEPASGGVVYICNHQSFLDPMLMAFQLQRSMSFMARDTLFKNPAFNRLITSVNAFPVRRNSADTGAMKETIRRVKAGGQVVLFAEGTRTRDGRIGPLLPGVALIAQRAAEWTVPVVIDGAFELWPRYSPVPLPGSIVVQYAPPIHRSQAAGMKPRELLDQVRRTMIEMQTDIRRRVGRPELVY